jgi:hypothetical protein
MKAVLGKLVKIEGLLDEEDVLNFLGLRGTLLQILDEQKDTNSRCGTCVECVDLAKEGMTDFLRAVENLSIIDGPVPDHSTQQRVFTFERNLCDGHCEAGAYASFHSSATNTTARDLMSGEWYSAGIRVIGAFPNMSRPVEEGDDRVLSNGLFFMPRVFEIGMNDETSSLSVLSLGRGFRMANSGAVEVQGLHYVFGPGLEELSLGVFRPGILTANGLEVHDADEAPKFSCPLENERN